jgi:hypothetical protein
MRSGVRWWSDKGGFASAKETACWAANDSNSPEPGTPDGEAIDMRICVPLLLLGALTGSSLNHLQVLVTIRREPTARAHLVMSVVRVIIMMLNRRMHALAATRAA